MRQTLRILLLAGFFTCCRAQPAAAQWEVDAHLLAGSLLTSTDAYPLRSLIGLRAGAAWHGLQFGAEYLGTVGTFEQDHGGHLRRADAVGIDVGYNWEIWRLRFGPRLGTGLQYLDWVYRGSPWSTRPSLDRGPDGQSRGYLDPGAVADLSFGHFCIGLEARYRWLHGATAWNAPLVLLRVGGRFALSP